MLEWWIEFMCCNELNEWSRGCESYWLADTIGSWDARGGGMYVKEC